MPLRDPPYCIWMLHQTLSAQCLQWARNFCMQRLASFDMTICFAPGRYHIRTSNFQVIFKFLWLCNHCMILCNIAHSQCGFTGARPCCPTFEQSQVYVLYGYCDSHFAQHLCVTVGIGQHKKMASLAWLQWFGELTALNATHVHTLVHASTVLISM